MTTCDGMEETKESMRFEHPKTSDVRDIVGTRRDDPMYPFDGYEEDDDAIAEAVWHLQHPQWSQHGIL